MGDNERPSGKLYPADELVDLLAVGRVPGLWQGGEGAGLHVLLTGLFVLALRMEGITVYKVLLGAMGV